MMDMKNGKTMGATRIQKFWKSGHLLNTKRASWPFMFVFLLLKAARNLPKELTMLHLKKALLVLTTIMYIGTSLFKHLKTFFLFIFPLHVFLAILHLLCFYANIVSERSYFLFWYYILNIFRGSNHILISVFIAKLNIMLFSEGILHFPCYPFFSVSF